MPPATYNNPESYKAYFLEEIDNVSTYFVTTPSYTPMLDIERWWHEPQAVYGLSDSGVVWHRSRHAHISIKT